MPHTSHPHLWDPLFATLGPLFAAICLKLEELQFEVKKLSLQWTTKFSHSKWNSKYPIPVSLIHEAQFLLLQVHFFASIYLKFEDRQFRVKIFFYNEKLNFTIQSEFKNVPYQPASFVRPT